ncbi:MAG TPA: chromate efflux transporter [Actinomycetota bacterium]|nr:chromate efflux transporter [Actinomycetota bacterium]
MSGAPDATPGHGRLWELATLFLRLGATAFGGPAAHVSMMHDEVVTRRRWLGEQEFLDLLGATNLIPGPNSTEMAIHVGLARARWRGLIVAGTCFILPAMLIVLALAWAYVEYGETPAVEGLLYGIEPVVIAIVVQALAQLGRTAVKRSALLIAVGAGVLALYLAGVNELLLLFGAGVIAVLVRGAGRLRRTVSSGLLPVLGTGLGALPSAAAAVAERTSVELWRLFLLFLKFGAVIYGSGYVLFAFIRGDLVDRLGWITEQQLVDALAVGQLTPGPVFTTATFIGYLVGGVGGALLATLAIFLPGFVFVAALQPIVRLMRRSTWTGDLLDGVNAGAIGLMAGVTWQLGRDAIVDVPTALLAIAAAAVLFRWKLNSGWLILAGAALGLAATAAGWV